MDLSLIAAPFVILGYWLGRRHDRRMWLAMIASNLILLTFGVVGHHWGLLVSGYLAFEAARNWLAWRREAAHA